VGVPERDVPVWRHRFGLLTAASTLFLVFVGGLVTSTGSGLAVPDWPLSYGMLMPPMVGGIFYEHGHRMVASAVGFLTLVLAAWTARAEPRPAVRRLAWAALAMVVFQGALGGLTVLFLLPTPISVAHACLAQAFFCAIVALAYATSREWMAGSAAAAEDGSRVRPAALVATGIVFAQLLLGALMRHTGAGLAIPDFPLAFGRLVPPLAEPGVAVHFAHRLGALAVLGALGVLALRCRRSGDRRLARHGGLLVVLAGVQAALGGLTVLSGKAVLPATAHVALGAAILGGAWLLALRARRRLRPAGAALLAPSRSEALAS
jgi:cytochrome c oxidase assembly protein subunit 15